MRRLIGYENSGSSNWTLFSFLANRASDNVIRGLLAIDPNILKRPAWRFYRSGGDPKLQVLAQALKLGLLPDDLRHEASRRLVSSALDDFDLSFFDQEAMLALITPSELVTLGARLMTDLLPQSTDHIGRAAAEADLSEDPESQFERFTDGLVRLESLMPPDSPMSTLIDEIRDTIKAAVDDVEERKREKERQEEDHSEEWTYMDAAPKSAKPAVSSRTDARKRSVFSDVAR